ncbi:MAG: hypothetical protein MI807_24270, partial [Verrucomicrobiales bacterium]|nr:hypothetical protein [Verrucomicrobiales bacterium]
MKKLVIFGDTVVAKLAHFYFTRDSDYEVISFTVDRNYLRNGSLCNLPVVEFETLQDQYSPSEVSLFVAMGPSAMNSSRAQKLAEASIRDTGEDVLSDREKALCQYARKLTKTPWAMVIEDTENLHKVGLDDAAILDLNQIVAYFAYANRTVLGLGVTTDG